MKKLTPVKLKRIADYTPSDDIGGRYVTQSNALTRAGHCLTLDEKRLVCLAISGVDSFQFTPAKGFCCRVMAADFAKECGIAPDSPYKQLKKAGGRLYQRSISFYEPAYNRRGKPIEPTIVKQRWVSRVKYHEKEGWIEVSFAPELIPHLTGLRSHFTSYRLGAASGLRSIYSWRLLELLMRFKSTGVAQYTVEDFRVSIDVPASYSDFGLVRQKIIEPAVNGLKKNGWKIDWKPVKAGRKIKALRFEFEPNAETLAAMEEPGMPTTIDKLMATIDEAQREAD